MLTNIVKYDFPWTYYTISNCLKEKTFLKIKALSEYILNNNVQTSTEKIQYNISNNYNLDPIYSEDTWFLKNKNSNILFNNLYEITLNELSVYFQKMILNFNIEHYYISMKYNIVLPFFSYKTRNYTKIHTDIAFKKYAAVLYISDFNLGTLFYDKYYESIDTKPIKIENWESNKLIFFERTENSWHNFRNPFDRHRVCLNIDIYNGDYNAN